MNNIERYEAFNKKLREILTLYEEVYFRNDGTYNIDSRTYELFEENPSALFVVFAEFCRIFLIYDAIDELHLIHR